MPAERQSNIAELAHSFLTWAQGEVYHGVFLSGALPELKERLARLLYALAPQQDGSADGGADATRLWGFFSNIDPRQQPVGHRQFIASFQEGEPTETTLRRLHRSDYLSAKPPQSTDSVSLEAAREHGYAGPAAVAELMQAVRGLLAPAQRATTRSVNGAFVESDAGDRVSHLTRIADALESLAQGQEPAQLVRAAADAGGLLREARRAGAFDPVTWQHLDCCFEGYVATGAPQESKRRLLTCVVHRLAQDANAKAEYGFQVEPAHSGQAYDWPWLVSSMLGLAKLVRSEATRLCRGMSRTTEPTAQPSAEPALPMQATRAGTAYMRAIESDPKAQEALRRAQARLRGFAEAMKNPEFQRERGRNRREYEQTFRALGEATRESARAVLQHRGELGPNSLESVVDWERLARTVEPPYETIRAGMFTARDVLEIVLALLESQGMLRRGGESSVRKTQDDRAEQPPTRKRRGRMPDTDPKADERIYNAWKSGGYTRYAELENTLGLPKGDGRRACDRHRKRLQKRR